MYETIIIKYINGREETVDVIDHSISDGVLFLAYRDKTKCIPLENVMYWEVLR